MLPAVPGSAPVLLSSPVVFTEEIIKARDSHNPSLEEQLVSPLTYTHCHLQARKPITKPGANPICVFYSSINNFQHTLFPFQHEYTFARKNTVAVFMV